MNEVTFAPMRSLRDLCQCPDVAALTPALHGLCSHFGRVDKLAILTANHEGMQQAICFLRMESPEKEQILMKTLGVGRFGGEVVFVVDLQSTKFSPEFGPSTEWANFADSELSASHAGR
ncbi:MAG: RNA-binding protein [Burkholderiaceae bacterium]|nr:RNA-binding protein [Burkholderiaceae bacterium]